MSEVKVLTQKEILSQELAGHKITDTVLARLDEAKQLTITDKESYIILSTKRKAIKNTRLVVEKVVDGKAKELKAQLDDWKKAGNEAISKFKDVEADLQAKENAWTEAEEKRKAREAAELKVPGRKKEAAEAGLELTEEQYLEFTDLEFAMAVHNKVKEGLAEVERLKRENERLKEQIKEQEEPTDNSGKDFFNPPAKGSNQYIAGPVEIKQTLGQAEGPVGETGPEDLGVSGQVVDDRSEKDRIEALLFGFKSVFVPVTKTPEGSALVANILALRNKLVAYGEKELAKLN